MKVLPSRPLETCKSPGVGCAARIDDPDGFNWLNRSDPRLLGATTVTREDGSPELWFSWNTASGGSNRRPNPTSKFARISADDFTGYARTSIFGTPICYCLRGSDQ